MAGPHSSSNNFIDVFNAALVELGVVAISSFLDTSIAARTGNALLMNTLEAALSAYPWRFARDRVKMSRLDVVAPPPWVTAWQIPAEALAIHAVYEGGALCDFDRFGQKIVTATGLDAAAEVWAEITVIVAPDVWAGHFRLAFIMQLAAVCCMPITQDQGMADRLMQVADVMMRQARSRDAQSRTASRIDTKMFLRNRRGGR